MSRLSAAITTLGARLQWQFARLRDALSGATLAMLIGSIAVSLCLLAFALRDLTLNRALPAEAGIAPASAGTLSQGDIASQLGGAAPVTNLPELLQTTARSARVTLRHVVFSPNTETIVPGLHRRVVSAELRGRYADIKAFVSDVLERAPALALKQLELVAVDDGATIEARANFIAVERTDR